MVGMGVLMLATSWLGWWLYRRARWRAERLPRALLWVFAGMTFSGWVATLAGWYVTEIGRQPFIVYGLIRTADVASTVPTAAMIGADADALPRALRRADRRLRQRAEVHGREARGGAAARRRRAGRDAGRRDDVAGAAGRERRMDLMSFDAMLPVIFMALMGVVDAGLRRQRRLRPRRRHADARATDAEKDVMVASIGPFWDANETWLVLGIGILLVAFPKAHGAGARRALPAGRADAGRA